MPVAGENELSAISKDPQALIRIPVGAASPLWGLFAGAAMSGAAWWWMTRWTRPANLEAVFGAAEAAATAETSAEVQALSAPVVEAIEEVPAALEPVVEAASDTVEAAIEGATPAPIVEALIEAAPEPVGGEAAPISPVLEALAQQADEPFVEPPFADAAVEPVAEASQEAKPLPKLKKTVAPKAD
jgi:hypothetical protein